MSKTVDLFLFCYALYCYVIPRVLSRSFRKRHAVSSSISACTASRAGSETLDLDAHASRIKSFQVMRAKQIPANASTECR